MMIKPRISCDTFSASLSTCLVKIGSFLRVLHDNNTLALTKKNLQISFIGRTLVCQVNITLILFSNSSTKLDILYLFTRACMNIAPQRKVTSPSVALKTPSGWRSHLHDPRHSKAVVGHCELTGAAEVASTFSQGL